MTKRRDGVKNKIDLLEKRKKKNYSCSRTVKSHKSFVQRHTRQTTRKNKSGERNTKLEEKTRVLAKGRDRWQFFGENL